MADFGRIRLLVEALETLQAIEASLDAGRRVEVVVRLDVERVLRLDGALLLAVGEPLRQRLMGDLAAALRDILNPPP